MELHNSPTSAARPSSPLVRQLASLKILSRLLSHELHAQSSSKTVQLSREELVEIQTTIDLFIEDVARRQGPGAGTPAPEPTLVSARMN